MARDSMKAIKTLIAVLVLFLGTSSVVNAQSKIAHINTQELLNTMPKMIAAQDQLKKLEENYRAQFTTVYQEYDAKLQALANLPETTPEATITSKQQELLQLQQNIKEAEKAAGEDIQKKQIELYQPIMEEARVAIQKVARAQGFEFVIDATSGGQLIVAKGKDLLADVKKELGF